MKYILPLVSLTFIFLVEKYNEKLIPVARITSNGFKISLDTIAYKKKIVDNFITNKDFFFEKTEIVKKKDKSIDHKEYYFISVINKTKHVRISRWLEKKGKKLYFVNTGDYKQTYLWCVGENDCEPNLFKDMEEMSWACGENPFCSNDTRIIRPCKVLKSMMQE